MTAARTTPLDNSDRAQLRRWILMLTADRRRTTPDDERAIGLPADLAAFLSPAREALGGIRSSRARRAARAVLLRLGQLAIERPESFVSIDGRTWRERAEACADSLLRSLDRMTALSEENGVRAALIAERIHIRCGRAEDVLSERHPWKASLVVASPPYPGVHVLYHRWQLGGRKELPLPFWIADEQDGAMPSYYTMGGRHEKGLTRYFIDLMAIMRNMRARLEPGAVVVQVVSFSKPAQQNRRFCAVLTKTGYERHPKFQRAATRSVPGRRWYASEQNNPASREFLLIYRKTRRF